ncbi:bifunctional Tetratricopeptide-like helical domain superfamily/Suppressor of forked/mRNA 3'-end-processing protein Rna14-like [Babesia duncani]|uniref:Bifunctional Tetratricopeptide-like helical domain superfamily/Suppressor of forked/mRNA 3'-end-processing protein Rna14-like n=1 Tax=Babesia duncani TaxID=323732 RepID=A0AAD9UPM0_9APIC|nr:bifunctional Tetratricopeptide-like helical domain superfamily/Suppressor of forked/mRNA 3'-end-processing protein Rna14-like [Babesia duncani]
MEYRKDRMGHNPKPKSKNKKVASNAKDSNKWIVARTLHWFYTHLLESSNKIAWRLMYALFGHVSFWRVIRWVPLIKQSGVYGNTFEALRLNSDNQKPTLLSIYYTCKMKIRDPFYFDGLEGTKRIEKAMYEVLHGFVNNFQQHLHLLIVHKPLSFDDYINGTGLCNYDVYRWSGGLVAGISKLQVRKMMYNGRYLSSNIDEKCMNHYRRKLNFQDSTILMNTWSHVYKANGINPSLVYNDFGFCSCFPTCNCYNTGFCNCTQHECHFIKYVETDAFIHSSHFIALIKMVLSEELDSDQTVTASQILTSVIPGFSVLIPEAVSSAISTDVPTKAELFENLDDDKLWYSHIKNTKNDNDLELACTLYPRFWKAHHRLALYYIKQKKSIDAYNTFLEAFKKVDDFDIRLSFLKFIYHKASIHEYIANLFDAIDKVGVDFRSEAIWLELTIILIKIYNCNLLAQGITNGLLTCLFPVEPYNNNEALIPTEEEQMAFNGINTLDKADRTYVQIYSEVNNLRKLFHRWLRTPTNNMRNLWSAYNTFEKAVGASSLLESKFFAEQKPIYDNCLTMYEKLCELYAWVYPTKPQSSQTSEYNPDLYNYWIDIIKFEEENTIDLEASELYQRLSYTFEMALVALFNCSKMWYMYFQFLLIHDKGDLAIDTLRLALDEYIPHDEKLKFVLASHLHSNRDEDGACAIYKQILFPNITFDQQTPQLKLKSLLQDDNIQRLQDIKPLNIIHYLNFIRRSKGRCEWRQETDTVLTKRELQSWELYWYVANVHLRCYKDTSSALETLQQAQAALPFCIHYTRLHLNLLMDLGHVTEARVMLSTLTQGSGTNGRITPDDMASLWSFWINMEYYYGTRDQYEYVMELNILSKVSNEVGMDMYTEKPRKATPAESSTLLTSIGDLFMKRNVEMSKREASSNMHSLIESQRRLFCSGTEFEELDVIFGFGMDTFVTMSNNGAAVESQIQPVVPQVSQMTSAPIPRRRMKIVRPDVSQLSQVDPTTLDSLESLILLHGSKRPQLPVPARPLDSIATPPKCLYDFLRLLPNSHYKEHSVFPTMYATPECIDYLIRTLEKLDTSQVELEDYEPIPVNQLLFIKATSDPAGEGQDGEGDVGKVDLDQGLYSVLRFLENNSGANNRPQKRQRIAI